jgi:FkbM family methyltransferase
MNLEVINSYFTPQRVLDIGANIGEWYSLCKGVFPESYIFSIEANDKCKGTLESVNPNSLIALLSKDEEMYDFYTKTDAPTATGNSIYREVTPYYDDEDTNLIIKKQGTLLDKLFPDETFDLIKMDIQGAELDAISGGINLCKKAKGILLEVALKEYNLNSPLHDEVVEYMKSIGFIKKEILSNLGYKGEIYHQDILFINENIIHNQS